MPRGATLFPQETPLPQAPEIGAMTRTLHSLAFSISSMIIVAGFGAASADDAKAPAKPADEKGTAASPAPPSADDAKPTTPEKLLESKGLTKDDRKYLLEEAEALKKYEEAKSDYGAFQKAFGKVATIVQYDESLQAMQMEQQEMQQNVAMMQQQINSASRSGYGRMRQMQNAQLAPMRQQVSQAQSMISQMNTQIQQAKTQGPKPDERNSATSEFDRTRLAFVNKVGELNELVAPLMEKYHELALDKSVVNALVDLRKSTGKNFKLGPSDELAAASKMIQNVKRNTAGPAASKKTTKKKGKK